MEMKMHLEANLPVIIFKERNRFIAYTPALDISTSGKTFNQVRKNFSILINLFMQESIKKGTI
jgi:predicted RNase H-like HicB family nuclease